ncbi:MAG: NDP-hexose 2,3-dehydratase family protein, partial [Floccifex sp.]
MKIITTLDLIESWACVDGNVNSTEHLLNWIRNLNATTHVAIREISINDSNFWFYDDYNGEVLNRKRSFFSIKGMRNFIDGEFVNEQPIIIQPEIGYLGIICKKIDGVLNFLMQAKIEPGNVNCVQISPTIQATKSNFTRAHGGKLPTYFELFENSKQYHVIYDQIQSEQATRFYKKRNRNMIMLVDEDIEVFPNFKWMTLGQIKQLMSVNNLVNMDTRTVLSGIPFYEKFSDENTQTKVYELFNDKALFKSMFDGNAIDLLPKVYQKINNFKMFRDVKNVPVPLNQLVDWRIDQYGITCKKNADFMVRYY